MFLGFFWLLFLIAIVVGLIYLAQSTIGRQNISKKLGPKEDPLEILKTRYAKGEISKEEFEQIKKDLAS